MPLESKEQMWGPRASASRVEHFTKPETSTISPGKSRSRNSSWTRSTASSRSASPLARVDLPAAILPQKKSNLALRHIPVLPCTLSQWGRRGAARHRAKGQVSATLARRGPRCNENRRWGPRTLLTAVRRGGHQAGSPRRALHSPAVTHPRRGPSEADLGPRAHWVPLGNLGP